VLIAKDLPRKNLKSSLNIRETVTNGLMIAILTEIHGLHQTPTEQEHGKQVKMAPTQELELSAKASLKSNPVDLLNKT
jgi:hypothetical protein